MRRTGPAALALALTLVAQMVACSDDDGQQHNNRPDATVEPDGAPADGTAPDAQATPDAAPATGCTGAAVTEPQPMGACCNADEDCLDGYCLGGWCTFRGCAESADCDPTAPGAFPGGTPMACNTNQFGFVSFCAPGSLQPCGGAGDATCPAGETCVLAWNEATQSQTGDAMRGLCMTQVHGGAATGATCDDHADPYDYQCAAPGYLFGSCVGRQCTEACDPTNPTDTCPSGLECFGPLAFETNGGLLSGGGLCGGALCGEILATGDPAVDYAIPGVDSECPNGQVCTPSFFTGADGDTFEFRCIPTVAGYGAPGDACEQADKYGLFCNHGTLCLQQQPRWQNTGAVCQGDDDCTANEVCVDRPNFPSRCSPKADPGFCTKGCRTDADCTGYGEPAYCVELGQDFPNGEVSFITACYPASELFLSAPTACTTDGDCDAGTGEGCLLVSPHTELRVCGTAASQDATGTDCSANGVADCLAGEVCIEDSDNATFRCSTLSELGEACDPAGSECRAGWCLDSAFETNDGGSATNTFCTGYCRDTSDCGPNQVCTNVLFAENDPALDTDNVVAGLCQTLVVRTGTGCGSAADCTGSQDCDTATGRCYTSGTAWGSTCAADADCDQGGQCDTEVPNGLCFLPGCDPAAGNADCGGGASACSAESVVGVCLASCTSSANCRQADGFTCVNGACVSP